MIKNYIKLRGFPLSRKRTYLFIDHSDYYLDNILIQKKVHADFGSEFKKPGLDYIFIVVSVHKRDEDKLLEAFDELYKKMLLMGKVDYEEQVMTYMKWFDRGEKDEI